MWQAPSPNAGDSTFPNESEAEETNVSSPDTDDPAENRVFPSPPAARIFCRLPVGMSPNIHSQRLRGPLRRTCRGTQRAHPYRMNFNIRDIPARRYDRQSLSQSGSRVRTQGDSPSFRISRKRIGNQNIGYLFDNQQEPESASPSPNDAERGNLAPTNSANHSHSLETLSQPRLQIRPSYNQSHTAVSQIDNNSDTANQLLRSGPELAVIPLVRTELTYEDGSYDLDTIYNPYQRQDSWKRLHFEEPISSPPPRIVPSLLPKPTVDATKLANSLIKLSRYLKTPNIFELRCLDCHYVPVLPITGPCGHTRCTSCIIQNGSCPCGADRPQSMHVNTVVREITDKMMRDIKKPRIVVSGASPRASDEKTNMIGAVVPRRLTKRRQSQSLRLNSENSSKDGFLRPRMPMTVQARYRKARLLLNAGEYVEAATHLTRVAASTKPLAHSARILLAQTISAMFVKQSQSNIARQLRQSVQEQSTHNWLKASELECVLCTSTYRNPVTTPCGHTFCRDCIERLLCYKKNCALCNNSLENFNLADTRTTIFISSILSTIDAVPLEDSTYLLPVVTCHVAYPGMPCPLFVFNPRYCLMVQRILKSGSRRFGMLGYTYANYGTVLEIRDCIVFKDKRCIVSTVGVSRFRVVERYDKDGCDVARVQSLNDVELTEEMDAELPYLAVKVYSKASYWLNKIDSRTKDVREEIQTAFGSLPFDNPEELGNTPDGPVWLWWLIAILPLNREIKFMILSTRSLLKRMMAVARALELVYSDFESSTPANPGEWISRNS